MQGNTIGKMWRIYCTVVLCALVVGIKSHQIAKKNTEEYEIKSGPYDCYGDVMKLKPTGRKIGGVEESRKFLENYVKFANKSCFLEVGQKFCIHPAVIAGVASRESGFGYFLDSRGYGDHGHAYGVMQCDIRICPVCEYGDTCTKYKYDSCDHIRMMTKEVLVPYIIAVGKKPELQNWSKEMKMQGGVAAYNMGVSGVRTWANLDVGTTGGDYSNDVIAEAQWLISYFRW